MSFQRLGNGIHFLAKGAYLANNIISQATFQDHAYISQPVLCRYYPA